MSNNRSELETLARAIVKAIDREAKKHPTTPVKICGALGVVAAMVVGVAEPVNDGADDIVMALIASTFSGMIGSVRQAKTSMMH